MTSNYYCQDCDKYINWEYKQRHLLSRILSKDWEFILVFVFVFIF